METGRPDKVCGVHFFNPAPVMALVEIVRPLTASDETIAAATRLRRGVRQDAGRGEGPGRLHRQRAAVPLPQQRGAAARERRGVQREDIDAAMKGGCSFPMGPFALLDLVGLDTSLAILDALYDEFRDPNYAAVPLLRRMVSAGQLGRKSGPGLLRLQPVIALVDRDGRPPLGDAHVLGPLHGARVERAVPHQPGQGPDRPVDRLRPAHPDRLRPRRARGGGRGRQGRRARRPPRPHEAAARRHPRRRDDHVDDDQRHRGVAARPLHRQRRGPGRRRRRCCRARPRTTSSRSTCPAARTSSRPSRAGG